MENEQKAFNNCAHNKLYLTFPNGNSLSTIWGYGTYSDNYNAGAELPIMERFSTFMSSDTVEIMVMKAPQKLIDKINRRFKTSDSVIGRLGMSDWLWVVKELSR